MPDGKQMYGPRFPNPAMMAHPMMAMEGGVGPSEDDRRRFMLQQHKAGMMVPPSGMRMMSNDAPQYGMQMVRTPRPPGNATPP